MTGAAGTLGQFILSELHPQKLAVLATDQTEKPDSVFPIHVAHLLDLTEVRKLMPGIDAIVHLANHAYQRGNEVTFNENVAMNMNVFQAAADAGVKKILFASSVQVIGSEGGEVPIDRAPRFPSFPLDAETPPFPTNTYALSKQVGEIQLRYFATCYGIEGIAIRFPGMTRPQHQVVNANWKEGAGTIRQAFSNLTYEDAARLVVAIIRTPLPGFRVYFPNASQNRNALPTSVLLERFYPGVPCRRPLSDNDGLVDTSAITRDTGWTPQDRYREPPPPV